MTNLNARQGPGVARPGRSEADLYLTGSWSPEWQVLPLDLTADRRTDFFLYNDVTGAWIEALVDGSGAFTYHSGTWDAGWRVAPAPFTTDGRAGLLLYGPTSGTWVRAVPTGPGTFTYSSGTFGTGLSLLTARHRPW